MHHNGFNFDTEISFASDGSFVQTNNGSGANSDKGKWEVSEADNFLRLTYQVWQAGCFRVVKRADRLVFFGCRSGKELLVELPPKEQHSQFQHFHMLKGDAVHAIFKDTFCTHCFC